MGYASTTQAKVVIPDVTRNDHTVTLQRHDVNSDGTVIMYVILSKLLSIKYDISYDGVAL